VRTGPVPYTLTDPTLITMSSGDPRYRGLAALEMIFHEASHAMIGLLEAKLDEEAKRQGKTLPPDLWHAILFYSAGEITRRHVGRDYVPYAKKNGLYERGGWEIFPPVLERDWQPYLEGTLSASTAVARVVAAF
jgi:hypothetical protein